MNRKHDIPTHDPQTGQPNPYYEELTGESINYDDIKFEVTPIRAPSIRFDSNRTFWKRLWVVIKNPFTYIFKGYIEV